MKQILGLDIGVSSIGMSIVTEENEQKNIEALSVRIVPEDTDFHGKFYSGNTASKNLARTEKRGIRRNNQRFKARRDKLYRTLKQHHLFPSKKLFELDSKHLYHLRAKAVTERVSLDELGRVLILLNQRRGFLSNRKSTTEEENSSTYKEQIAELEKNLDGKTIGQKLYEELQDAKNSFDVLLRERTYQRSSYTEEFDRIWDKQKEFYPDVLTGSSHDDDIKNTLYDTIKNKTIFYQRPLKSQKGLISECPFEKHHKAIAKSSPYFEVFRIWQKVNDLSWKTAEGKTIYPTLEQKQKLKEELWCGNKLNTKQKLTISKIKEILGYGSREKIYLNFTELDGSRTYSILNNVLIEAEIENPEQYLFFNPDINDEKGKLFELWHVTYSLPTEKEVINTLQKRFNFTEQQAQIIAQKVGYTSDYGSLSTRAIRKLLPYLEKGLGYSEACDQVGYDHSGYKTEIELKERLKQLKPNSLRNPVVEQILNQVVNMVNLAMDDYGQFDEIRVELARELRNSAKTRQRITANNRKNRVNNQKIKEILTNEYGYKIVNGRDVKRYVLWQETKQQCLYCNNPIKGSDMLHGNADIEHILPKSRSFSNAMNNFILAHRTCNKEKGQQTAYDFMASKGEKQLQQYIEKVNNLYNDGRGSIFKIKFENLLCRGENIPSDFVERMKKDSQYIAKEAVKILKQVCPKVVTTTGQVTDFLRDEWGLKNVLQELGLPKYKAIGQTEEKTIKTIENKTKTIEVIKDWSKRDDHRHHAVDALICALTDQKLIFRLNNLNKIYQYERQALGREEIEAFEKDNEGKFSLKEFSDQVGHIYEPPIKNLRKEAKEHLEKIFISYKKEKSKVLTKNINRPKNGEEQQTWVPRHQLHEATVMGRVKRIADKKIKLSKITTEQINLIVNPQIKALIQNHLLAHDDKIGIAFANKNLKNNPIIYKKEELKEVVIYEWVQTKRVTLNENISVAKISKIIDKNAKEAIELRLEENGGKIKEAFKNLTENPIRLKNGHIVKSVTVYDTHQVIEISTKKDHFGNEILNKEGNKIPTGYVMSGNNHHALIYKNEKGEYKDEVVSFWAAVKIGLANVLDHDKPYPIINRNNNDKLGAFQFSMQNNDLVVFDLKHRENPQSKNEMDFFDPNNRKAISDKLFRVQKISKKSNGQFSINFRHHLETQVIRKNREGKPINEASLKGIVWERVSKNIDLSRISKIRLNHLGKILKVGE